MAGGVSGPGQISQLDWLWLEKTTAQDSLPQAALFVERPGSGESDRTHLKQKPFMNDWSEPTKHGDCCQSEVELS